MVAKGLSILEDTELSLLLFGGKGGVGKTTCSAAAALALARRDPERRILLASTDPAHSLSDSFAGAALPPNLEYREIDFRESLERFKQAHGQHFQEIAQRGTFLDAEDIDQFLELSAPGFDELMALLEIAALLEEPVYSCIVLDTAPTGHTLRFLELPELMTTWIRAFDAMLAKHRYLGQLYGGGERRDEADVFLEQLQSSIQRLADWLKDPRRCRFVPVMLAEAMSLEETSRLVARLRAAGIGVSDGLVNRLFPSSTACTLCGEIRRRQQEALSGAGEFLSGMTLWGIPMQGSEIRGEAPLRALWDSVFRWQPESLEGGRSSGVSEKSVPRVEPRAPCPSPEVRWMLFAGKGGVGKTTLACATAWELARRHPEEHTLLFSTDPAHSLADCLQQPIGREPVLLAPGISALEMDAESEFAVLKQRYQEEVEAFFEGLLTRSGVELEFDHDVVQRILDLAPPGLDEVMALLQAVRLYESEAYDRIVLDTAPSGHLIRLLETPELIDRWLKATFGLFLKYRHVFRLPRIVDYLVNLSKQLKQLRALLADPERTHLLVVSIATEMAFQESMDLLAACRAAPVHVPALFLNMATPPGGCSLCDAIAGTELAVREQFAERLSGIAQAVVYRSGDPRGRERLAELGAALYDSSC